jgi:hypothetical protein
MTTLVLPLRAVYFDAIRDGTKPVEYRLCTPYWRRRLEGRSYSRIVLTKGYPKASDTARRLERPWRGFTVETLTHPHFGPAPVQVFAIPVEGI